MKIDIEHFTKKLHGRIVLDDVNLHFDSGDKGLVVGLQGINGSGKTMLIRALCGLIYATQGTVAVDGQVLGKDISFPPSVGALIENPSFLNEYTGRRNLELLSSIRGTVSQNRIDEALNAVGLNPNDRRTYRKYSLGMKQRLGIAAAILEQPQLLLLDEPFNALDQGGVEQVSHVIQAQRDAGSMIFLACHDANELYSLSDIVVTMKNGIVASSENIRRVGE
ncbi:MAG: ATP-binding cassette domain-containing protein [Oscillospiraceae bacterium]|nr:ATP-binding cassette domain-containing protein [Oscillospiraceae bacterium]